MNEADPIGNDTRKTEHIKKLGRGPHICLFCGRTDPPWHLIAKTVSWLMERVPRSILEDHHVFLEALDPESTVRLCILCHFGVTQGYVWAGIAFGPEPDPRRRVAFMLRALSVFFEMLEKVLWKWSELLLEGERQ